MKHACTHPHRTVPSALFIRAESSQEIIGEAMIEFCVDCAHMRGSVRNGSLFNPRGPFSFEGYSPRDIETLARKALANGGVGS